MLRNHQKLIWNIRNICKPKFSFLLSLFSNKNCKKKCPFIAFFDIKHNKNWKDDLIFWPATNIFFDNLVNGSIYSNIIIFVRWEQCWLYDRIFWFDLDLLIALANPSFDEVEYLFSKELLLFLYLIQDLYRGCFCLFCCWLWCCWADISVYITYIALNFNDQPFQTMIKLEPKYFL